MWSETAAGLQGVCGAMLGLAFIATALRFYARKQQKVEVKVDDWILLPTFLFLVATCAGAFYGINKGVLGQATSQDPTVKAAAQYPLAITSYVFDVFSAAALGFIKISALFFYKRLFCATGRNALFRAYLTTLVVFISAWIVTFIFLPIFQCGNHISALWSQDPKVHTRYCTISAPYVLSLGVSDFLLEVVVVVTPFPRIAKLKTTNRAKLGVALVFLTALVSLGASTARMVVYIQDVEARANGRYLDFQVADTNLYFFGVLEIGLALVAVNLPSLYILRHYTSPEQVLGSIRSVITLSSNKVRSSSRDRQHGSNSSSKTPLGENIAMTTVKVPDQTRIQLGDAVPSV